MNQMFMYQTFYQLTNIGSSLLFSFSLASSTRGHNYILYKPFACLKTHSHFWSTNNQVLEYITVLQSLLIWKTNIGNLLAI